MDSWYNFAAGMLVETQLKRFPLLEEPCDEVYAIVKSSIRKSPDF